MPIFFPGEQALVKLKLNGQWEGLCKVTVMTGFYLCRHNVRYPMSSPIKKKKPSKLVISFLDWMFPKSTKFQVAIATHIAKHFSILVSQMA